MCLEINFQAAKRVINRGGCVVCPSIFEQVTMNATMATFFCTKSFIQTIILTKYPLHKHKTMSLVLIFSCFLE